MSKNTDKIAKALTEKGYVSKHIQWEPIGEAPIMEGPTGGWYIEYATQQDVDENGFANAYEGIIVAYNIAEALGEIDKIQCAVGTLAAQEMRSGQECCPNLMEVHGRSGTQSTPNLTAAQEVQHE